jgi:hypothetical protein
MQAQIPVKDRAQKVAIERAMQDPAVKAFVIVMGLLAPLSEGGKRRVLSFVTDHYAEVHAQQIASDVFGSVG